MILCIDHIFQLMADFLSGHLGGCAVVPVGWGFSSAPGSVTIQPPRMEGGSVLAPPWTPRPVYQATVQVGSPSTTAEPFYVIMLCAFYVEYYHQVLCVFCACYNVIIKP